MIPPVAIPNSKSGINESNSPVLLSYFGITAISKQTV